MSETPERCIVCDLWTVSHRLTRPNLPPLCIACEYRERRAPDHAPKEQER